MAKLTWAKRIEDARARGKFNAAAKEAASEWTRCAVGEHSIREKKRLTAYFEPDGIFPRNTSEDIGDLGCIFGNQVEEDEIEAAAETYAKIQQWFAKHGKE